MIEPRLQSAQDARPAPLAPGAIEPRPAAAIPLAPRQAAIPAQASEAQASEAEIVAICKAAAEDCAFVMVGFARVLPERLWLESRGAPREAFARQLWMAGLVRGLGFSPRQVGAAINRHEDTVKHACGIIAALHGEADAAGLIAVLGEPGVRDFLGGKDLVVTTDAQGRLEVVSGAEAVEELLEHAERLIDRMCDAFQFVAVQGGAYRREIARQGAPHGR